VLIGDIESVGPRAEIPELVCYYSDQERELLRVKPGLTSVSKVRERENSRFVKFSRCGPRRCCAILRATPIASPSRTAGSSPLDEWWRVVPLEDYRIEVLAAGKTGTEMAIYAYLSAVYGLVACWPRRAREIREHSSPLNAKGARRSSSDLAALTRPTTPTSHTRR